MNESRGRPDFIPSTVFRAWLTRTGINKLARIDGIAVCSYVDRCERLCRPIPYKIGQGSKRWRMLDIIARARAEGVRVDPAEDVALARDIDALRAELTGLTTSIAERKHEIAVQGLSTRLTGATLLTEPEIAAARLDLPARSGVYFLLRGPRVVYVGQSVKVFGRVLEHTASKDFDGFAYVPCAPSALDVLESLYIHVLRPELNNRRDGLGVHAPLRLDALIAQAAGALSAAWQHTKGART